MNTDYICSKASQKLWIIRRLKKYKLDEYKLLDVYEKEVRSVLEYAVPVWHSGLTHHQSNQIERVQKQALRIILDQNYINYEVACTIFSIEPLYLRRIQLCINFAKTDLKRKQSLFLKAPNNSLTRRVPKLVKELKCRTKRYQNSSMPYLSKLINNQ